MITAVAGSSALLACGTRQCSTGPFHGWQLARRRSSRAKEERRAAQTACAQDSQPRPAHLWSSRDEWAFAAMEARKRAEAVVSPVKVGKASPLSGCSREGWAGRRNMDAKRGAIKLAAPSAPQSRFQPFAKSQRVAERKVEACGSLAGWAIASPRACRCRPVKSSCGIGGIAAFAENRRTVERVAESG